MLENRKKIYSMLLEGRDALFLSTQYASSLEEAVALAKIEYMRINHLTEDLLAGAKIGLYTIKTINEIITESKDYKEKLEDKGKESFIKREESLPPIAPAAKVDTTVKTEQELRNELMSEIIKNNDYKLYTDKKDSFTKSERKYLEDKLGLGF